MQANDLKKRIMRRVYAIWFVRIALPMVGGSFLSLAMALKLTADGFFVAEVLKSFSYVLRHNFLGFPRYIEAALNSVEPSTLILVAMAGTMSFALAVKLLRSVRDIVWSQSVAPNYIKQ